MRGGMRILGLFAVVACAAAAALLSPRVIRYLSSDEGPTVPTVVVERADFRRSVVAEGTLEAVKATPLTAPHRARRPLKVAWLMTDGARVKKGDVVVRFDPTDFEKELADGRSNRSIAASEAGKQRALTKAALQGRDRSAELAELELAKTRKFRPKDAEIFSRHQILESSIDERLSAARLEHAGSSKKIEKEVSGSKMALLKVQARAADQQIERAEEGLSNLEVRVPHDGIFLIRRDWRGNALQVGDTVWPGRKLAEIPLTEEMEARVFVLEADAGDLAEGQAAVVALEAEPSQRFDGKVAKIESLAKPRVRGSPVQYFGVTLAIEERAASQFKPGQRVRSTILIGADDALVVPRQAVVELEGKAVVYRKRGGAFESVDVELGAGSPGLVVIESGLEPGDRVALVDPTARPDDSADNGKAAPQIGAQP